MIGIVAKEARDSIKEARKLLKKSDLAMHIGSVAIGLEALETLLIEKGILKDDELMERIKKISAEHYAQGHFVPGNDD